MFPRREGGGDDSDQLSEDMMFLLVCGRVLTDRRHQTVNTLSGRDESVRWYPAPVSEAPSYDRYHMRVVSVCEICLR